MTRTSSTKTLNRPPAQLSFEFEQPVSSKEVVPGRRPRRQRIEIIPPTSLERVSELRGPAQTPEPPSGRHETHAFQLYLRSHDMMVKALKGATLCAGLILLVKGGVPLEEAMLPGVRFTEIGKNRHFTGLLALLTIFFSGLSAHYALQTSMLGRKCGLPFDQIVHAHGVCLGSLLSKALQAIGLLIGVTVPVAAVYFAFWDMVAFVSLMVTHIVAPPIGDWITIIRRS
jgi:hypothetical protein